MFPHIKQSLLTILVIASVSAHIHAQQEEIVVTEGTPINVAVAKEVTSKEAKPNDPVDFTVAEDLVINGQVIVRKGTPAIGSVINAEKGGYMGKSGKLAVQVESTTTSDGKPLKLRAAKGREGDDKTTSTMVLTMISPAFLFRKGSEAKITPGTIVTVYVAEEKRFRVEGATLVPVVMETTAASSEEATVFIYRPSKWTGKALEPSVFVDETELARMDNGRYFAVKLKPGKHAEGAPEEALRLMRAAADLDDATEKHPVTPGAVLPAREQLGELLLELKQPAAALEAFETALRNTPNRFNALYGAARAATLTDNRQKAAGYYRKLVELGRYADSVRPELKEATAFVAKAGASR